MTLVAEKDNFASPDQILEDCCSTPHTAASVLALRLTSCIFCLQALPVWSLSSRQCLMAVGGGGRWSCKCHRRIRLVEKCLKVALLLCLSVKLSLPQSISREQLSLLFKLPFWKMPGYHPCWKGTRFYCLNPCIVENWHFCYYFVVHRLQLKLRQFPSLRASVVHLLSLPAAVGAHPRQEPAPLCKTWQGAAGSHRLLTAYIKFTTSRKFCSLYVDSITTHIKAALGKWTRGRERGHREMFTVTIAWHEILFYGVTWSGVIWCLFLLTYKYS